MFFFKDFFSKSLRVIRGINIDRLLSYHRSTINFFCDKMYACAMFFFRSFNRPLMCVESWKFW